MLVGCRKCCQWNTTDFPPQVEVIRSPLWRHGEQSSFFGSQHDDSQQPEISSRMTSSKPTVKHELKGGIWFVFPHTTFVISCYYTPTSSHGKEKVLENQYERIFNFPNDVIVTTRKALAHVRGLEYRCEHRGSRLEISSSSSPHSFTIFMNEKWISSDVDEFSIQLRYYFGKSRFSRKIDRHNDIMDIIIGSTKFIPNLRYFEILMSADICASFMWKYSDMKIFRKSQL